MVGRLVNQPISFIHMYQDSGVNRFTNIQFVHQFCSNLHSEPPLAWWTQEQRMRFDRLESSWSSDKPNCTFFAIIELFRQLSEALRTDRQTARWRHAPAAERLKPVTKLSSCAPSSRYQAVVSYKQQLCRIRRITCLSSQSSKQNEKLNAALSSVTRFHSCHDDLSKYLSLSAHLHRVACFYSKFSATLCKRDIGDRNSIYPSVRHLFCHKTKETCLLFIFYIVLHCFFHITFYFFNLRFNHFNFSLGYQYLQTI